MMPQAGEAALENVAYTYDGSLEGLLSAVFLTYARKEHPTDIVREDAWCPRLGQSVISVTTDFQWALRVRTGIERAGGSESFQWVLRASLFDDQPMGLEVWRFVRTLMAASSDQKGRPSFLDDSSHPAVAPLFQRSVRALNEAEHLRQFARFSQLENGVWFCCCNPNVSVVPLVVGHFARRFGDQPFVIYDEVHCLSGAWDGATWALVPGKAQAPAAPVAHDELMQEAWQCFYDALCVDARYNPELRRSFMPQRFWTHLPEMHPAKTRQGSTPNDPLPGTPQRMCQRDTPNGTP